MTGPVESVLGIDARAVGGGLPGRSAGPLPGAGGALRQLQGAIFTLDSATGLCTAVERIDIR